MIYEDSKWEQWKLAILMDEKDLVDISANKE